MSTFGNAYTAPAPPDPPRRTAVAEAWGKFYPTWRAAEQARKEREGRAKGDTLGYNTPTLTPEQVEAAQAAVHEALAVATAGEYNKFGNADQR